MTDDKYIVVTVCCALILCRSESKDLPVSSSPMEVDSNDLVTEVNGIKVRSMVEENIDYSSCTVDNKSNSPHAITDHLSDGVTLAVADNTTPEVDRDSEKVWAQP